MGAPDFVRQARAAGVRDERVLDALRTVPRSGFVPSGATAVQVARDAPVPLPCHQTTSQPSLIALMLEAVEIGADERVLEVGTGYGYEAALIGRLADEVWTVEMWPELAEQARENLVRQDVANVHVVTGDGRLGLPEHAPYDVVVVAAQTEEVPDELRVQLRPGGRLVVPLGPAGRERCQVMVREPGGALRPTRDLGLVRFVPLLGG